MPSRGESGSSLSPRAEIVVVTVSEDVWHPGERAAQSRAGVREAMAAAGERLIGGFMPAQHRDFLARLPLVMAGGEDNEGNVWALPLFGPPGFIRTPSPTTLTIEATPPPRLASCMDAGHRLALLGIDFSSRRRSRVNGVIRQRRAGRITVSVRESYGNCSRFIRSRHTGSGPRRHIGAFERVDEWTDDLQTLVGNADTCFLASACPKSHAGERQGLDISHRGGDAGFIRFDGRQRLLIPDYPGNNFFNTIGNLMLDGRAGLLLLDFPAGRFTSLTTAAEVFWQDEAPAICGDHARMIRLTLKAGYTFCTDAPFAAPEPEEA